MSNRRELIEMASFAAAPKPLLVEDASRGGKLIVRGEFGRSGVPTANRRVYPRRLWEREFDRLREAIANRSLTGELNHPKDGRADMFNTAHLITGLTINPDGVVIGEAEVLEETPGGLIVASIYRRGGKVGVSSRGFGSTEVNEDGVDVVQEDYQLVTFDFVSDPADATAYPEQVNEASGKVFSFGSTPRSNGAPMTESKSAPESILKATAEIREAAERGVYEKLVKDPGSLPAALQESLRAFFGGGEEGPKLLKENKLLRATVAELQPKLKKAEADLTEAVTRGREATYRYFVEKCLANDPDAEQVREQVGKVLQYESVQALRAKIEEAREGIAERRRIEEEATLRSRQELEALQEERAAEQAQLIRTQEALERSLALNKELAVQRYRQEAIQNSPPAARRVLESTHQRDFGEVDEIMESLRPRQRTPEEAGQARARARQWVGSPTRNATPMQEERSTLPENRDGGSGEAMPGLGASWGELRALSGVGSSN